MSPVPVTCRSCGARIFFAETVKGKRIPLDEEPNEKGQFVLDWTIPARPFAVHAKPELPGVHYVSHFATCPDAQNFRRPR